jgi:hypothetical protein
MRSLGPACSLKVYAKTLKLAARHQRACAKIGRMSTGQEPAEPESKKNPAAVALGKLGGKKGGTARAAKLPAKKRKAIAKKAALARWGGA